MYTLTKDVVGKIKSLYEKTLSQRDDNIKIRKEEFDLLKIGKNYTINIELKSQEVTEEKIIKRVEHPKQSEFERLFRPQDYLISPLNTPEKFLHGHYYLKPQANF